jgi:kynurenine formamidase
MRFRSTACWDAPENLNNLDVLPPFCLFLALPLKVRRGSGSPVRAVALVPR